MHRWEAYQDKWFNKILARFGLVLLPPELRKPGVKQLLAEAARLQASVEELKRREPSAEQLRDLAEATNRITELGRELTWQRRPSA